MMGNAARLSDTKSIVGVSAIVAWRNPFKILKPVVRFLPIAMIGLIGLRRWFTYECAEDDSTDTHYAMVLRRAIEMDMSVAALENGFTQDTPRVRAMRLCHTANTTISGSIINTLPLWNAFPSLHSSSIAAYISEGVCRL